MDPSNRNRITLTAATLCTLVACSSEDPSVRENQASSGGSNPSTDSGGAPLGPASGGSSNGGSGSDRGELEFGSGGTTTAAGGGTAQGTDGGLVPLTQDQIDKLLLDGPEGCETDSEQVNALPPVLQFVVDISGSMGSDAPGNEPLSKWDVTADALLAALDALPDEMPVGLQLYPTEDAPVSAGCFSGGPGTGPGGPDLGAGGGTVGAGGMIQGAGGTMFLPPQPQQVGTCVGLDGLTAIEALGAMGSPHRTELASAIDSTALYDGTPTHDAYMFALEESLRADTSGRRQFMLLITDGAPTQTLGCGELICDELSPDGPEATAIIEAIASAHAEGIDTYVIGAPGSENGSFLGDDGPDMRPWLSQAAEAGGTAAEGCTGTEGDYCHFDMTQATDFGQELAAGLSSIAGELEASCDFEIPQREDVDLLATEVVINWGDGTASQAIVDTMGDCTEGWRQTGDTTMELCPTTCSAFQAAQGASVTVAFNCVNEIR